MKKYLLIISLLLIVQASKAQSLPQLGKDPVSKVIAAMTLEEKASFVVGASAAGNQTQQNQGGTMIGQTQNLVAGAAGTTIVIPRLGIPSIVLADGPAGLRISPTRQNDNNTYYCTAFPVGTLLASSWDAELVYSVGKAMGNEVLEYGVDILLGPGMNIHRNPLCGRNFEYYSEDPLIVGKIASAMINGVESNGVGTSAKHYAANNAETNRNTLNTIVSERALREIYLKGFGIAVQEVQPMTIMSSYNLINGTWAPESYDLITKVLRDDWKFGGFVMTDWGGGRDAVAMMKAGNDLLMPGSAAQVKAITEAVQSGKLDQKILDRNIERMLNIILQSPRFKGYKYTNKPDLKQHAEVARIAAAEGMILLKNENSALPLPSETKKLALFGNSSYDIITGGTGSGDVNEAYSISLSEGLKTAGYSVNDNLETMYNGYLKTVKDGRPRGRGFLGASSAISELTVNQDVINSIVNVCDAAVITIGRNSGEGSDRKADEGDFELTKSEKELIKNVSESFKAKNKKTIVILNVGGVIETVSWKDIPDAILLAWQGGQESGNSIADIVSGKVNPSGKLATTFPVKYADVPSSGSFPGKVTVQPDQGAQQGGFMRGQPSEITYEDGIYVGYRYYNSFNIPVSYEFGYGLSYTTFQYSDLKLSSQNFNKTVTVTFNVKNTGTTAGREVAELYLTAPASKLDKPAIELKGFAKTKLLKPGEMETISIVLDNNSISSFDPSVSAWVAEKGKYEVKVGSSSNTILLSGTFTLSDQRIVKKESVALVPGSKINELKAVR
ncbi:MAG TPA: glycoside hydrolase family 3 C-terminal domain-containing protein [Bacteroidales bacterium]|nr:glycoside hydrolase family 3 C-terminal domain-containing protein [Bacteroidales bacterium]